MLLLQIKSLKMYTNRKFSCNRKIYLKYKYKKIKIIITIHHIFKFYLDMFTLVVNNKNIL